MEKYFGKIIHGDCIEEIKKIPDNSVDLIFADLILIYLIKKNGQKFYNWRIRKKKKELEYLAIKHKVDKS